jgi:uncharacterized membrane protein YjjB (DUF3815 family)
MNPMFAAALGSILRWGLSILAGYLVSRGIWSDSEAGIYVGAAAIALTSLLWSVIEKYLSRVKLVTALATPGVMSEKALEQVVKNEDRRPPVTLDKDRTPYPVGTPGREETSQLKGQNQ